MNEKDGINELKYRVAMLKVNYLLKQKLITDEEYKKTPIFLPMLI